MGGYEEAVGEGRGGDEVLLPGEEAVGDYEAAVVVGAPAVIGAEACELHKLELATVFVAVVDKGWGDE